MNRTNVQDFYPLSPMQQGMLFHSLLSAGSGIYVEQFACSLEGRLHMDAFRDAWRSAQARHAVLRTAFVHSGLKEPVQAVYRNPELPLRILDWRGLDPEIRRSKTLELLAAERRAGFELSRPPLLRLTLALATETSTVFVWTYHHLLLDGWSVPILLGEIVRAYEAHWRGESPALPPARPYRDYVVWQRRQDPKRAEDFWRAYLKGFRTPTPLGIHGASAAAAAEMEFGRVARELPPDLFGALLTAARSCRVTLSTMVRAAWAVVLSRYSGERDVVFGATVAGRPAELAAAESMIGLFINTLPVRARIERGERVSEFLTKLQAQQLELDAFSYTPLLDIQQWSEAPRGAPLFESMLVVENYPLPTGGGESSDLRLIPIHTAAATSYPLTVVATPGAGLAVEILYQRERFTDTAADRMLGHLETVLEAIAKGPGSTVDELPLLSGRECRELVYDRNATAADIGPEPCIHNLFERQVQRTPDADALVCGAARYTYRRLNRCANALARGLRERGVGPEVPVALFTRRSPELVIAMLGVLKCGGAYVPLDPAYPEERLRFMLEDCGAPIVLAEPALAARVPAGRACVVPIDSAAAEGPETEANPQLAMRPENLAYVIYTSGSTGTPKGVLVPHKGVCNVVLDYIDGFRVGPGWRFAQLSSPSFDAAVMEIFTTLCSGATLVLPPPGVEASTFDVASWLDQEAVSVALIMPGLLSVLDPERLPCLRTLITGGEACAAELARRWMSGRRFLNAYGPTETTVGPSYAELAPEDITGDSAPIGRPIRNARMLVLDEELRPAPPGVPGELYVGGMGLARGYLNRTDLTAERFPPDPFGFETGGRLYKTGDLVRWTESGQLEYLSRRDDQFKVRGFRVEPGEIEAALERHPGVQKAVVVVVGAGAEERRLAAFYVQRPGANVEEAELRALLGRLLPAYMIPSTFILNGELPLNPNGKVDRKALAACASEAKERRSAFLAPRDYLEEQLVRIWQEVLQIAAPGIQDDFFALGGHSLLAVRMAGLIQKRLDRQVQLSDIVLNRTIEQLAARMRQDVRSTGFETLTPLRATGSRRPLFFVHPSGGSVHWYAGLAALLDPEQPFYAFQACGLTGEAPIDTAIDVMARRYVAELRALQPEGPYQLGSWSMGVSIAFEMARQLRQSGQEVQLLAMFDQGPFPPGRRPTDDAEYLVDTFGKHVPLSVERLRQLEPEEQLRYTHAAAREVRFIYPDTSLEQFSLFVRLLRTHIDAWRDYPLRTYEGRVTLFRARDQLHEESEQRDLGWSQLALGGVEIREVPGDHLTMLQEPNVRVLAEELTACLEGRAAARGVPA